MNPRGETRTPQQSLIKFDMSGSDEQQQEYTASIHPKTNSATPFYTRIVTGKEQTKHSQTFSDKDYRILKNTIKLIFVTVKNIKWVVLLILLLIIAMILYHFLGKETWVWCK